MKLKPGKYVQRDGGIATVAAVDERRDIFPAVGWNSRGMHRSWNLDGSYYQSPTIDENDLIREHCEPREFWIAIRNSDGHAAVISDGNVNDEWSAIRVREVIE